MYSPAFPIFIPTPRQFVTYLVDSSRSPEAGGVVGLNPNWRPQWASCPHCSFDFDVIGKIENFERDTNFILEKLGIQVLRIAIMCIQKKDILNWYFFQDLLLHFGSHESPRKASSLSRQRKTIETFFADIPKFLAQKLYLLYRRDFKMFHYKRDDILPPPATRF